MNAEDIILQQYGPYLHPSFTNISQIGTEQYPIPTFPAQLISELCNSALEIFKNQPTLLTLTGNVMCIGDTHGNIFDVVRIFKYGGYPISQKYLFLGDYVDRGEYSIDLIVLLLAMTIKYPQNCFLIRGNHELKLINAKYGFFESSFVRYKQIGPFNAVNEVFNYLPIAAVVNQRYFCVHGGISQYLKHYHQINKIKKPFDDMENSSDYQLVSDILWSDPIDGPNGIPMQRRNIGIQYNEAMVAEFLNRNKLEAIVRAHTPIDNGVARQYNNMFYTVFSSSDYELGRQCGVLLLSVNNPPNSFAMNPIQTVNVNSAVFHEFKATSTKSLIGNKSILLTTSSRERSIVKPILKKRRAVSASLILHVYSSGIPQVKA